MCCGHAPSAEQRGAVLPKVEQQVGPSQAALAISSGVPSPQHAIKKIFYSLFFQVCTFKDGGLGAALNSWNCP